MNIRCQAPDYSPLGVYLHRVIDPGNVGTVVRACGALGPARLALSPGCSDPLAGKGVRASMGAVFRVPIQTGAELPADGLRVALVADADTPVWEVDLTGPTVLAVGAERHGLPAEVLEACDVVCCDPAGRRRRVAERGPGGDAGALRGRQAASWNGGYASVTSVKA